MKRHRRSSDSFQDITKDEVLDVLGHEYLTTNFMMVSRVAAFALGLDTATYLVNLINLQNIFCKDEDKWFWRTNTQIEIDTSLTLHKIQTIKKKLISLGVLEIKAMGVPRKDYYRVDIDLIREIIAEKFLESCRTRNINVRNFRTLRYGFSVHSHIRENKEDKIDISLEAESSNIESFQKNKPSNKAIAQAKQLAEIILSKRKMKFTSSQISSWAVEIHRLHTDNGVDPSRVRHALDWYAEHIGGEYVPVIQSGKALRDKFPKLEAAIERDKAPRKTPKPNHSNIGKFAVEHDYDANARDVDPIIFEMGARINERQKKNR